MKSSSQFYCELVKTLHHDIAQCYYVARKELNAERNFISSRVNKEGLSFLTQALPALSKALDKALSSGTKFQIVGFKLRPQSAIPKFLGWLLELILDEFGNELDHPDPIALSHFKQLCTLVYKLEVPNAPKKDKSVLDAFIDADYSLTKFRDEQPDDTAWLDHASNLVTRVVSPVDRYRIKPRHGPGAVATGEKPHNKSQLKRIYPRLEQIYPFTEWMCYSLAHVAHAFPNVIDGGEATAKVVLVPKDSRGPRVISCEPLEVQWIQQGLATVLMDQIETSKWSRGQVNFRDQNVNRRLAMEGSITSNWVTLDMKEASDRVSVELVARLFAGHPLLLEALMATRSSFTKLPCNTIMPLNKFAPMGSSLCFPVEALCFWALSVSALRMHGWSSRKARKSVFVYGDDIITTREAYPWLLQYLPKVGLLFNSSKCCTARFFRESCGCDAYKGVDVTPVKLKTVWCGLRDRAPDELSSYVAFSNAMYGKGFFETANYVRRALTTKYGEIPYTNDYHVSDNGSYVATSSAPMFATNENAIQLNRGRVKQRFCRYFHRLQYLMWKSEPVKVRTKHDGYAELLRRFSVDFGIRRGAYAQPRRNRLKRGWCNA